VFNCCASIAAKANRANALKKIFLIYVFILNAKVIVFKDYWFLMCLIEELIVNSLLLEIGLVRIFELKRASEALCHLRLYYHFR
jgi:hypothetical protein